MSSPRLTEAQRSQLLGFSVIHHRPHFRRKPLGPRVASLWRLLATLATGGLLGWVLRGWL